jgi:hypothetical protein
MWARRAAAGAFAAVALAAVALAACSPRERVEPKVWTLYDMEEAFERGAPIAIGPTLPEGLPAGAFLISNPDGNMTLKVQRAFADGQPAAFVSTDVWVDYGGVIWLQPLYAQLLTDAPPTPVADAPRVIDVGPDSAFYSPFWQVHYAVVGDVAPDRYQSSKALLDGASAIIPAGMRTCPVRPPGVVGRGLALPPPWEAWNASIALQTIPEGTAVITEEEAVETVGLFDFGPGLFELAVRSAGTIVAASPMYLFVDANGTPLTDEPRVLGAGAIGIDAASGLPRPRTGGLWQVWEARLPATAGAFHGAAHAAARDAASRGNQDALDYEGRVALNASACFEDAAAGDFPGGCLWLDSRERLESLLGAGRLIATEISQSGPIVLWHKQPVPVNQ